MVDLFSFSILSTIFGGAFGSLDRKPMAVHTILIFLKGSNYPLIFSLDVSRRRTTVLRFLLSLFRNVHFAVHAFLLSIHQRETNSTSINGRLDRFES